MNRSHLFSILCVSLLISSLCIAGCTRDREDRSTMTQNTQDSPLVTINPVSTATTSPAPAGMGGGTQDKTCSQLGGDRCIAGEDCNGSWLDARDSFSCCSKNCTGPGSMGEVLVLEPFEPSPTMDELEGINS